MAREGNRAKTERVILAPAEAVFWRSRSRFLSSFFGSAQSRSSSASFGKGQD